MRRRKEVVRPGDGGGSSLFLSHLFSLNAVNQKLTTTNLFVRPVEILYSVQSLYVSHLL